MRPIDADALPVQEFLVVEDIYGKIGRYMVVHKAALDAAPTIEPEVRHGHWENIHGMDNTVFCSECLAAANKELAMKYKGCPFCLARMDGGADNG